MLRSVFHLRFCGFDSSFCFGYRSGDIIKAPFGRFGKIAIWSEFLFVFGNEGFEFALKFRTGFCEGFNEVFLPFHFCGRFVNDGLLFSNN